MQEKKTIELEKILGRTHPDEFDVYIRENSDSMLSDVTSFCAYFKEILKKRNPRASAM